MRKVKEFLALLKEAGVQWYNDNVFEMGAALAYYSVFSIAPLFVVAIGVAGLLFGEEAARGQVVEQLRSVVGPSTAETIDQMIVRTQESGNSTWTMIVSIVGALIGASWVFGELRRSLNKIWCVTPRPGAGWWATIRDQLLPFVMVLATGILLLISLILSAGITAVSQLLPDTLPGGFLLWRIANGVISFLIIMLLFAVIFRRLPDVELSWTDVWVGACFTALLFTAGKYLIGLYLGRSGITSPYGAAGSMVLILLWVYYSALIVLFGAEFTRAWANKYGSRLEPSANAMWIGSCGPQQQVDRAAAGGP